MLDLGGASAEFQDLMFSELHHRFYNSLQVVSSALDATVSDQRRSEASDRLRGRIAALSNLHRRLATPITDLADMRAAFAEVCIWVTEGFALGRVELDLKAMTLPSHPTVVRGLTLIMIELVTNALKHGPEARTYVRVGVKSVKDRHELIVAGGSHPDRPTHARLPDLATRLATALGGTLYLASEAEYVVRVIIPAPR